MLDLSTISQETLIARGQYASVRGKHKDAIAELAKVCGLMQSLMTRILREAQPEGGAIPSGLDDLSETCQLYAEGIERLSGEIESLARQRAELKQKAWG